jgi:pyruvate formate lyase activating enzyme
MQIKHIQKTSLIDYPGHISSIIFVGHCNFSCPYCYNYDLVHAPQTIQNIAESEIIEILKKRKKYIEGVCLTGGEPTIQDNLSHFLQDIKKLNLKIKLDTNGYNPRILAQLVEQKLIDYLAMDIKAPADSYHEVAGTAIDISNIKESVNIVKNAKLPYEFRTTVWQGYFEKYHYEKLFALIGTCPAYYLHNYFDPPGAESKQFYPATKNEIAPILNAAPESKIVLKLRGDWY